MNVSTIVIPREQALEKLDEYRHIAVNKRRTEDLDFRKLYKAASVYPVLDVANALKETGTNEHGHPKLAFARANWSTVHYSTWENAFSSSDRYWNKTYAIKLPTGTYSNPNVKWIRLSSPVPFAPPALRPEDSVSKYHILFEVEKWTEYPADPFLLKHITGWLYAVIGEWDLTELERTLLSGLR